MRELAEELGVRAVLSWEGTPRNASDEHSELRWFAVAELMQLRMSSPRILSLFSGFASI